MYNTRSSGGDNQYSRKSDNFRPLQPQQTKNLGTPPKLAGQAQMQYQNRPQLVEGVSNMPLQSQPLVQAPIPPPVSQFSEGVPNDNQNNMLIKNEDDQANEEPKDDKTGVRWPSKRKVNKKEQKKRLNARMRRLVCPKSPLMVFSELYKEVPIKLVEQPPQNNFVVYTASIEVDGQVYTGDHVSKTQAKQKACENFLRVMLAKKMNERSEKKEESFTENEVEVNENVTSIKPKGPPQEDFPWPHFASLAMHNLIAHWELQPVTKVLQDETIAKSTAKAGMKKFPDNPETYNPVQLLHQMTPGITFKEVTVSHNNPSIFQVLCEISNVKFNGEGSTKKAAKRECAIQAIKHFWNFDFHLGKKIIKQ